MNPIRKLDFRRWRAGHRPAPPADPRRRRAGAAVLGLTLDGSRLEGVVVRRTNGSLELRQRFAAALALDPLTAAPELVGREIRKHLDAAGIRERRCVVGLPPAWALTLGVALPPELPEADRPSFLQLEAERGFPYGPESLRTVHSVARTPQGDHLATLVAIPRDHIARLETVLQAAQLRPVSFSLAITALLPPDRPEAHGVIALLPGEQDLVLQVTCGGGVVLLRCLEGAFELEGAERRFQADAIARELRITLGRLPSDVREALRGVRVLGSAEMAEEVTEQLAPRLAALGLTVEQVKQSPAPEGPPRWPADAPGNGAWSLAARHLAGGAGVFEFLPPRVSPWQQWMARYASRRLVAAGAAAGLLLLLVLLVFGAQQVQLWYWDAQWQEIKTRVFELETVQANLRKYRPWFDDSFRSLSVLRRLTEAFPEDGVVSAKTVEIRASARVTCTGTARDLAALNRTIEKLGAFPEVSQLQVEQTRGRAPLQFSFNFQWNAGGNP